MAGTMADTETPRWSLWRMVKMSDVLTATSPFTLKSVSLT